MCRVILLSGSRWQSVLCSCADRSPLGLPVLIFYCFFVLHSCSFVTVFISFVLFLVFLFFLILHLRFLSLFFFFIGLLFLINFLSSFSPALIFSFVPSFLPSPSSSSSSSLSFSFFSSSSSSFSFSSSSPSFLSLLPLLLGLRLCHARDGITLFWPRED